MHETSGGGAQVPRPHLHWATDGPTAASKLQRLLPAAGGRMTGEEEASALDARTVALIATAVAVALECDECVAACAWAAAQRGAGEEEVDQAAAVGLLMRDGVALPSPT